jgi:predicted ABC-type transport system involved in lysophospholipase L1 biosynthesis ATPase subunit
VSESILSARQVFKTFRSGDGRIEVLTGVDLEIGAGDSISIRGESGSGKSTLLNLLAGLDKPDQGELKWETRSNLDSTRRAKYLGMVFQSYYLIPELNARHNVLMAARIAGSIGSAEKARADQLLDQVGLKDRKTHLSTQLSGGEMQRVAIARALMNCPRVILADEPTGNLDERTGNSIMDLLLDLCAREKVALVLVTHNKEHAQRAARRTFLHLGQLTEER